MKNVYAYIRVSTTKQGEGVSLEVQKEAIERYATSNNLSIVQWFEEKETAAKQGRPMFSSLMKLLGKRQASGVIMHKIDRSARNLKDWADLGTLIDQGVEVYFVHESLDLQSRGGRLSADIQAIIAADYIRNLRQETIKGMYGRLKQGFYPLRAPIGYLNNGKAKFKTHDPVKAPLVRKMFELYATRKYSLKSLCAEMKVLGLRNSNGRLLTLNGISTILNNDFYVGIMSIKGQKFNGGHEPLISPELFRRVQLILRNNTNQKKIVHDFKFRKMLTCNSCGNMLSGEVQKEMVYYRCHTKSCVTKSVRESYVDSCLERLMSLLTIHPIELKAVEDELSYMRSNEVKIVQEMLTSLKLQKTQIKDKLEKITDLYIDGQLDADAYASRKEKLLWQLKTQEDAEKNLESQNVSILERVRKIFEQLSDLKNSYKIGIWEEQRELVETLTSNLKFSGKEPMFTIRSPFSKVLNSVIFQLGDPNQGTLREIETKSNNTSTSAPLEEGHKCVININTLPDSREPLSPEALKVLIRDILDFFRRRMLSALKKLLFYLSV